MSETKKIDNEMELIEQCKPIIEMLKKKGCDYTEVIISRNKIEIKTTMLGIPILETTNPKD
ncbi:MAG: hypothetical protein SOT80_10645 [Candidatus Pseudoruminococcus sp.]|nr:hypothetical protein [Candidatus Pseudoruminococcus sp.]